MRSAESENRRIGETGRRSARRKEHSAEREEQRAAGSRSRLVEGSIRGGPESREPRAEGSIGQIVEKSSRRSADAITQQLNTPSTRETRRTCRYLPASVVVRDRLWFRRQRGSVSVIAPYEG